MKLLLTLLATINLSGAWQFSIDRSAEGTRPMTYGQSINLPGSMLTNGLGDEVSVNTHWIGSLYDSSFFYNPKMERYRIEGNMKFPFFLTPDKQYVGNAWYRRTVKVPKQWKGQRVTLFLERPHIETTLLVNGQEVGHQMSLSVPHQFDITDYVLFGKENTIEIKIYNGIENVCVGQDSHSVTDQTQGDWNGIVGKIELRNEPIIWRQRVEPDVKNHSAKIFINDSIYNITLEEPLRLWDEDHPELYTVNVNYQGQQIPVTFGMRDVSILGRNILLNGNIIRLRGTVGNCCFPETGYPPTDVESWEAIFRKCKEYGLNSMRFHSYCPPEAAFIAADKLGFYLQPEGPSWPNHGVKLGQGMAIDTYLLDECKAIIDQYGSHPSLVMMAAGNEPAGRWVPWCNMFVKEMHKYDPTRIYSDASVGGGWAWAADAEFHIKGGARGLDEWNSQMPQSMDDFKAGMDLPRNFKPSPEKPVNTEPIVSHETGQWCAFPDLSERSQYTGAYKAKNFDIFEDLLNENGMGKMDRKFLMASGKLQVLAYKFDLERNMRTPDYAGFLLLGLNDYSGQGTALVGPLNVHWKEKGYCTAEDWTEFCSDIVPLARFPKFVFSTTDTIRIANTLYNTSRKEVKSFDYAITDASGKAVQQGQVGIEQEITYLPASFDKPQKLTLTLRAEGHKNHWDFWVYPSLKPETLKPETQILLADTLDAKTLEALQNGANVLLTCGGKVKYGNDVVHRYLPVFWNTSWFKMRPPHTTGSYIQNQHPIFKDFPTDDWQNLNWWELVNKTQVMNLANFPKEFQPIVQPIDTWHISRKLGMLLECRVGKGKLVMTTMDLSNNLDKRLVARQLRLSVLNYMQSDAFKPAFEIPAQTLSQLFTETAPAVDMFTKDTPDELKPRLNPVTTYELQLPVRDSLYHPAVLFCQHVDSGISGKPLFSEVTVDEKGFLLDGKPVIPVMGEIHYSRVPREDWAKELEKMKKGGVNIVSTYVFWSHHEPQEGHFDWTGNKDLRAFVETCQRVGMPIVLRVGPFCHGEVLMGGIPAWIVEKSQSNPKQFKLRSLAPGFMQATRNLYGAIFSQVNGLLFKQGGPIIGMQIENECRGPWPYYKALKQMALEIGYDLPFYTRTGWPKLNGKEEFGEMLPLYGDYADGFWDRSLADMPGAYPDAFVFKPGRISENIATETFSKAELKDDKTTKQQNNAKTYPYLTCELGGGMMTAYHRRIQIFPKDALSLAICKVGSGSNLPGYYMYHGGTNPGRGMAERQNSPVTNYNDMPELSYDFQSPIGEMGQLNESYMWTMQFHSFLRDFGGILRDMDPVFPATNCIEGRKDSTLRYTVRTDGRSGFVFVNNYLRMLPLSAKNDVQFKFTTAEGKLVQFPVIDIPTDACFVLPFGLKFGPNSIDWATAQPSGLQGKNLYFVEIPGIKPQVCVDGKVYTLQEELPIRFKDQHYIHLISAKNAYALPEREADRPVHFTLINKYNRVREVKNGNQKVAEQPSDEDFKHASVWTIERTDRLPANGILEVNYVGDVARVYADDKLVQDNQWNGLPMLVRCSQLRGKKVEIRILPLSKDYPIYFQPAQRAVIAEAKEGILCDLQRVVVRGENRFGRFATNYPDVHDPVMARGEDGRYYIFSTGFGVGVMSSADLKEWRPEPSVFSRDEIPAWAIDSVRGFHGHIWAPDISFHNGLWHLYYSCSTFGKNGSAIGLAVNKTLDPTSPDFAWEDRGPVIVSHRHKDNWNAIDPNLITDGKKAYLDFGSFWDGIQLIELDKDLQTPKSAPVTIARRKGEYRSLAEMDRPENYTIEGKDTIQAGDNAVEAPFIIRRGKYFYLFVSQDYCCRGKNSTYRVVYGRSKKITGPYLDRQGYDMAQGGGTRLFGPTERFYGIGHNAVVEVEPGQWLYLSHAYDANHRAQAKLFLQTLRFGKDGWIE